MAANWLGVRVDDEVVLFATPSKASEAWIAFAKDPTIPNIETIQNPENLLCPPLVRRADGKVEKDTTVYQQILASIQDGMFMTLKSLTQLMHFKDALQARVES